MLTYKLTVMLQNNPSMSPFLFSSFSFFFKKKQTNKNKKQKTKGSNMFVSFIFFSSFFLSFSIIFKLVFPEVFSHPASQNQRRLAFSFR